MQAAETPQQGSLQHGSPARLIAVLAAGGFASTFAGRVVEPLVGVLARDLASPPATVALLSTAFALPYALIQPILGPVGDALGKERVVVTCLVVMSLALAACTVAGDIGTLFGLRMVAGAAAGGVIPLSLAMMGDRIPMAQRQVAIGRFLVAVILGQLSGSTIAGLIEGAIGWRGVFALATGVGIVGLLGVALGFARRLRAPGGRFALAPALARYRTILRTPRARVLFAAVFVEAVAVFGIFPHLAHLIEARGEGGPREAGLVLAGFAAGGLTYSLTVGLLLRLLGQTRMLMAGGAVSGGALLTVGLAGAWQTDAAALVALGLGFYMLHNTFQVQVTEVVPEARASAVALHAFSFFCGQAIGVAVLGLGLETLGQLPALALCAATILAVGLVTARRLARPG
ncbi:MULTISPECIES: MFS transporter [Methylobacterium]|jgi:predicted MFS family arabinose efflux permease|uniref:MFS transporter n=1 Tax=Methylobacterium TaxID=407 RepID=UPI0008E265B1|nr:MULTISPECIES: MFS transporter [Methylobacterium]MBZ6415922.1 MFS transporter [Methylobacterium sp.]MBK3397578.1 MFS transporter [Methylobacterium ajmalii]MBK3411609.1 MFS transporter [Methylobacterium ajmalii]MBK3422963.1 MFS transporter [Methylobacterium ajmalii]SFF48945.1 Predicted arabinose efflux permease, MFS family [Methylobacterium sp. yr596]